MPIVYALHENNLTDDPTDYRAMVSPTDILDLDDVIARMLQGGSTVTKEDTLAVLESYHATIIALVLGGSRVNTPLVNFGTSVRGSFNGQTDAFDPNRHTIEARLNTGTRLRDALRSARPQKNERSSPLPSPLAYLDINSGEPNSLLTPGGMGQLSGYRLKIDPTDPEQGIFLIHSGGTVTRVQVIGQNTPGQLMFMLPAPLPSGSYTLEVRARFGESLRSGDLDRKLSVP